MTDTSVSIQTILSPELALCSLPGSSKKKVLEEIAQRIALQYPDLNENTIFNSLIGRERLGSTGIGQGIAIPHCRLENCQKVIGALLTLEQKVPFDAIDNEPVDLLFVLVVPQEATSEHLELLSQLAEKFNNPELCHQLRCCKDSDSLYKTIIQY